MGQLSNIMNVGSDEDTSGLLAPIFISLLTHLELSPVPRGSESGGTLNLAASQSKIDEVRLLGNTIRSVVANMFKLSQLLLILIVYTNKQHSSAMAKVKTRLSSIVR